MIKYGILYDPELVQWLEQQKLNFDRETVIARSVQWKRDVVMEDEFDTGARMKLNLGHTMGHGVEACSRFAVSHGKAVAIGMAMVSRAAVKNGTLTADDCTRILSLLDTFGLPVSSDYSADELYRHTLSDKKRSGGSIRLIVPRAIGDCDILSIPVTELKPFLEAGL